MQQPHRRGTPACAASAVSREERHAKLISSSSDARRGSTFLAGKVVVCRLAFGDGRSAGVFGQG
jgi:hypothetical protein